jgi:spermidine synthase
MPSPIEELDYRDTPLGELVLRRRRSPSVPDAWVYEVKLDDALLMSSAVNASERALAGLALDGRPKPCDVLIGGLGLGYTAAAALEYPSIRRVVVVELLDAVIDWHRNRLVPMADRLLDDPRCSFVQADFFEHIRMNDDAARASSYDVVLLDVDHSPESWLHASHRDFYGVQGMKSVAGRLRPDGVFGLWSASRPGDPFLEVMRSVFPVVKVHEVTFFNPHLDETMSNWVVITRA